LLKPDAPKTASNRANSGSRSNIALTVIALAVLGLALARLGPTAEIRAAEPALLPTLSLDPVRAQDMPDGNDQRNLMQLAQSEMAEWGAAFGTAPPPAPEPEQQARPEPALADLPEPEPEPVDIAEHDRSGDYWLTGRILAGPDSVAFVHDGGDEQVVRAGSTLSGGETVIEITAAGVVAQHGDATFLIVLRDDSAQPRIARQTEARATPASATRADPARRSFIQQARARETLSAPDDDLQDDDFDDDDWDDDDWDDDDDAD